MVRSIAVLLFIVSGALFLDGLIGITAGRSGELALLVLVNVVGLAVLLRASGTTDSGYSPADRLRLAVLCGAANGLVWTFLDLFRSTPRGFGMIALLAASFAAAVYFLPACDD